GHTGSAGQAPVTRGATPLFQSLQQVDSFNGGNRGLETLVAGLGAGTFHGLLDGVGGEHAEGYGYPAVQGNGCNPLGHLGSHIVEMRCRTADNGAQADDGIVFSAFCQLLGCQRNLECPWNAGNMDILVVATMTDQGVNGTFQQTFGDEAVETADNDPEFEAFGFKLSFKELRHVDLPYIWPNPENWISALTKSILQIKHQK